jgi:transcriptional regulator with XRE-family HTH domain
MARRGVPKGPINWYLSEWMAARGLEGRGAQTKMMALTGWSKATMSQLFNGTQDYSPKVVNEAAAALSVEPWELLMPPERAMAIRKLQSSAERVVTLAHDAGVQTDVLPFPGKPRTGTEG